MSVSLPPAWPWDRAPQTLSLVYSDSPELPGEFVQTANTAYVTRHVWTKQDLGNGRYLHRLEGVQEPLEAPGG